MKKRGKHGNIGAHQHQRKSTGNEVMSKITGVQGRTMSQRGDGIRGNVPGLVAQAGKREKWKLFSFSSTGVTRKGCQ